MLFGFPTLFLSHSLCLAVVLGHFPGLGCGLISASAPCSKRCLWGGHAHVCRAAIRMPWQGGLTLAGVSREGLRFWLRAGVGAKLLWEPWEESSLSTPWVRSDFRAISAISIIKEI